MTDRSVIVELYSGDDVESAADSSRVRLPNARSSIGPLNRLWQDVRNAAPGQLIPSREVVTGTERCSGRPLTVLFSGSRRLQAYITENFFDTSAGLPQALTSSESVQAEVTVDDRLFGWRQSEAGPLLIRTPRWVRMQVALQDSWPATLSAAHSAQAGRLGRYLRRFGYTARLNTAPDALATFRSEFLVPEMTRRFGSGAILASEGRFLADSRGMLRLDLLHEDQPVAANLIRVSRTRLIISKGARLPGRDDLKGRMDVLDYFTLLLGQCAGVHTVDFGLCRANLEDGPLLYKLKWGAKVAPADGHKADTRIRVSRLTPATGAILRRNRFFEREGDGYVLRILADSKEVTESLPQLAGRCRDAGVGRIELLYPLQGTRPPAPQALPVPVDCRAVSID